MFEIDREHPEYKARRITWKRYRDLYTGGQEFLNNAAEYLIQRHKEPVEVYAERLQRVFYENYIGSIVDWYAATLFRREPLLSYEGREGARKFFGSLTEDCDLRGSHLTDFLRRRLIEGLVQGTSWVLVDFPKVSKTVGTRAEEDEIGASRAYLVGYSPDNITNWSYDEHGRLEWVVVKTERLEKDSPDQEWNIETTWTYYNKQEFQTYRRIRKRDAQDGEIRQIDSGFHGLAKQRRVPLFQLELQEGLWLLNRAGSLQIEHFNKSNALSWALTMGLFATPVVYSDRKWNQIVGESYYIQLGPQDRFGWTEPEGRVYEIAAENLVRLQEEIYRVCYLAQLGGPLNASQGQSGLSKQRDFTATQEVLRAIGDSVKDLARRVLLAIQDAREDDLRIDVAGLDEFDIGDFSSELSDAERLLALGIDSPTLKKQVFRRLALKYLCDVRQSVKDEIAAEIDRASR